MISVFLPLVALAFATTQFEGTLALFPHAALVLWTGGTMAYVFFYLPKLVLIADELQEFDRLSAMQTKVQWASVAWIVLLQAVAAPGTLISPRLYNIFPQAWPMLVSTSAFLVMLKAASFTFHKAYQGLTLSDQSTEEFFRARLTLPILFFPPMILWMGVEDFLSRGPGVQMISEIWIMITAPFFFVALYLFSPYLFNIAWRAYPLEEKDLEKDIIDLAARSRTKITGIKIWNTFKEPLANAAVAGLSDRYRFIYITRYLIDTLGRKEILAILAHELGHFRLSHVWTYLLFTIDLVFLSVIGRIYLVLHYPGLVEKYSAYASILDPLFFIGFFLIIFTALTRFSERQADRFASSLVGAEGFAGAMETLQEYIGTPSHKLPWWIETHPEFSRRIADSRQWSGHQDTLIKQAQRMRVALVGIALLIVSFGWSDAAATWQFAKVAQHLQAKEFAQAETLLGDLSQKLGRHPQIVEFYGKLNWRKGDWLQAISLAAERAWNIRLPQTTSEVFQHPISPEVAFQFQIMQFLLQALDLRGAHGIPLFNESFDFLESHFSHG